MNQVKENINILVIGDTCTDKFVYGPAIRIAPEAPVPVLNPKNISTNLGMAGNVVNNLKSLGVNVLSIVNEEIVTKTRYVDDRSGQILLRVDENDKIKRINKDVLASIKNNNLNNIKIDAIIISDYDKGFLKEKDIKYICQNNFNVFIDTKKIVDSWISDATFIKINHIEFERTKYTLKDVDIEDKLVVTLSSKGCKYKDEIFPVKKVSIKDVSGAGDTFLSGLVVEYIKTKDIRKAILFAQKCATIVVQKLGVSTI